MGTVSVVIGKFIMENTVISSVTKSRMDTLQVKLLNSFINLCGFGTLGIKSYPAHKNTHKIFYY